MTTEPKDAPKAGWVGFDLDGTLAHYAGWGDGSVGQPIEPMVELARAYLSAGREIRIVTARVSIPAQAAEQRTRIEAWCLEHLGAVVPVTHEKDFTMALLYDDRAVQVEKNTGRIIGCEECASRAPVSP